MKKIISQDPLATAQAFADFLAEKVNQQNELHIALSGGSTPKLLFELMADDYDEDIAWEKIHFWWGDERCVAPTDAESNYKMTKERLFDQITIPSTHIHRVRGEDDPAQEALRYAQEIKEYVPLVDGVPQFDIMLLGMGGDGHTASIFPHQMELLKAQHVCAVASHPESGQKRVTLTGPVIDHSKSICFLVTGEAKAQKIDEIFNQKEGYLSYPASHFIGDNVIWFLDQNAIKK